MKRRTFLAGAFAPALTKLVLGHAQADMATPTLSADPWDFKTSGFNFHELQPSTLIFNRERLVPIRSVDEESVDEFGIPMRADREGHLTNNPVTQSQYLMRMLSNFHMTQDEEYLQIATSVGHRLYDYHDEIDGAFFYPYMFDYPLRGDPSGLLVAPWYSGMAQGQVLQSFIRLWHATQDEYWREWAESTAESFTQINQGEHPGIMRNTASKDLWIEEYPDPTYFGTLNGHLFACLGLYEYWLVTRESRYRQILDGAMTTVLENLENGFRVKGQPSRYAMNQDSFPDRYHIVHTAQLLETYRITNERRFAELAIDLFLDYPPYQIVGDLELSSGTYDVYPETHYNPHLLLGEPTQLEVKSSTSQPVHWRKRLWDENKFYYRFTDDDGAWYIEETDAVHLTGEYIGPHHDHGPIYGTRLEFDPPIDLWVNPNIGNTIVSAMAIVDGSPSCKIANTDEWASYVP